MRHYIHPLDEENMAEKYGLASDLSFAHSFSICAMDYGYELDVNGTWMNENGEPMSEIESERMRELVCHAGAISVDGGRTWIHGETFRNMSDNDFDRLYGENFVRRVYAALPEDQREFFGKDEYTPRMKVIIAVISVAWYGIIVR